MVLIRKLQNNFRYFIFISKSEEYFRVKFILLVQHLSEFIRAKLSEPDLACACVRICLCAYLPVCLCACLKVTNSPMRGAFRGKVTIWNGLKLNKMKTSSWRFAVLVSIFYNYHSVPLIALLVVIAKKREVFIQAYPVG